MDKLGALELVTLTVGAIAVYAYTGSGWATVAAVCFAYYLKPARGGFR